MMHEGFGGFCADVVVRYACVSVSVCRLAANPLSVVLNLHVIV